MQDGPRLFRPERLVVWRSCPVLLLLLCAAWPAALAQSQGYSDASGKAPVPPSGSGPVTMQQLQSEIQELKGMVLDLQKETVSSRAEITRLRQELATQRSDAAPTAAMVDQESPAYSTSESARLDRLEEDQQLLSAQLDTQDQVKVESASKYRVRLSGIVLFNLFGNSGSVDNQDVPTWAKRPSAGSASGSVGGTMRQSIFGLETFGPDLFGAHTSATINFDLGGGFPALYDGVNSGLVRLRTADVKLDWKDTTLVAGQDTLFIAPLSPTSFASVIVPPLSYAGNLWAWTPQLRVEHRFTLSKDSSFNVQGGLLDPMTGEPPDDLMYTWYRTPNAGEQSRAPAVAAHVAYNHRMLGQNFTVGAGGYYSKQNWGFDRIVNAWAATLDANLPITKKLSLSASGYRGAAIGGLGGALGRSVIWNGDLAQPTTDVQALNTVGGWGQLKFRATSTLEFNGAFGIDNPFASDLRYFGLYGQSYAPAFFGVNRGAFGNVIYRPRSDLVFAAEYRRLRTFTIFDNSYEAGQANLSVGVLF